MRGNAKTAADPGPFSGQKLRNTGDGRPPFARIALRRYVSRTMLMFRQIFALSLSFSPSRYTRVPLLVHLRKCTGDKDVQRSSRTYLSRDINATVTAHVTRCHRIYIYMRICIRYRPPFLILLEDIRSAEHAKRFKTRPIIDFRGITGEMKFIEIKISSSSPLDSHFSSYDFLSSIKNKIVIADRLRTTTTTASTTITTTTTIVFGFV